MVLSHIEFYLLSFHSQLRDDTLMRCTCMNIYRTDHKIQRDKLIYNSSQKIHEDNLHYIDTNIKKQKIVR